MDLGYKLIKKDGYWQREGGDSPAMGINSSDDDGDAKKKTDYPSFYVSDAPSEMEDIPDEGTATIRYKVTSRTVREDVDQDKRHCDVNIDILSFDPERPKMRPNGKSNPRDAIANSLRDFMLGRASAPE